MEVVVERFAFTQKLGEKMSLWVPIACRVFAVYPTGTVDLMTIVASGLMAITSLMTASMDAVLK